MHLLSILSLKSSFYMAAESVARLETIVLTDIRFVSVSPGRLSSFGFSGTIAHGVFVSLVDCSRTCGCLGAQVKVFSRYRYRAAISRPEASACRFYMTLALETRRGEDFDEAYEFVTMGHMSSFVNSVITDHVVSENILLPGVGYIEMALASSLLGDKIY